MSSFDEMARDLEAVIRLAAKPFRPLLKRADRYLDDRNASPLGQTLIVCSPMFLVFFLVLIAIDFH